MTTSSSNSTTTTTTNGDKAPPAKAAAVSSSSSSILSGMQATLGADMMQKITSSNILMIGAGGIGCELLKNLALSGFGKVHVVDLDTIDVSNLNRQLLFRSQHVGQPKCTVAAAVAAQMAPSKVQYTAIHGNVMDKSIFNVPFVQTFDLVLSALDNVQARRVVNRLCLAAAVPLVEAGTTGYLGQVSVIHKPSGTACYECVTQEPPKVYPICTIRSTPSQPVHTIVWAKELYKLLFGEKVEESMLYEDPAGEEPSTYMSAVLEFRAAMEEQKQQSKPKDDATTTAAVQKHAQAMIQTLYVTEIQKQLDMDRYKTARKTPVVLDTDMIVQAVQDYATAAPTHKTSYKPTNVWSAPECVAELAACLHDALLQDAAAVLPAFDKDDAMAMRLVTAASNLRSTVFGIEPIQSLYDCKGIAGAIIPAISTTNAVCAGQEILQALRILQAQLKAEQEQQAAADADAMEDGDINNNNKAPLTTLRQACSYINCLRNATRNGLYLTASNLEPPNPNCFVCKAASITVTLTVGQWTLQDFLTKIVKGRLGFQEPSIELHDGGDCIWEEGQDADQASFEPNLKKLLPDLPCGGIKHGGQVTIEDFSQDLTVNLIITNQDTWPAEKGDEAAADPDDYKFVIGGSSGGDNKPAAAAVDSKPAAEGEAAAAKTNGNAKKDDEDDDDDFIEIVEDPPSTTRENNNNKRAPDSGAGGGAPPAKKAKTDNGNNSSSAMEVEIIEID